jgi:hypothetical protein
MGGIRVGSERNQSGIRAGAEQANKLCVTWNYLYGWGGAGSERDQSRIRVHAFQEKASSQIGDRSHDPVKTVDALLWPLISLHKVLRDS